MRRMETIVGHLFLAQGEGIEESMSFPSKDMYWKLHMVLS
jgi:hypothetical protein